MINFLDEISMFLAVMPMHPLASTSASLQQVEPNHFTSSSAISSAPWRRAIVLLQV